MYICDVPYFWAHYEITVVDEEENPIGKQWQAIYAMDGIITEHLHWFWNIVTTKGSITVNEIPSTMGKMVPRPEGFPETILRFSDPVDFIHDSPLEEDTPANRRAWIWHDCIRDLLKEECDTIDTPEGKKRVMKKITFPTVEEQRALVEKIYKEQYGDD